MTHENSNAQPIARGWLFAQLVVIALLVLGTGKLAAQVSPRGNTGPLTDRALNNPMIRGRVFDELTRVSLGEIWVHLEDLGGTDLNSDVTDRNGLFGFLNLAEGTYVIRIDVEGFKPFRKTYTIYPGMRGSNSETIFLERYPGAPPPPALANVVTDSNVPEKARKAYGKGLEELLEKRQPEKSLKHFLKAIEIYPEFHLAYLQLGTAHLQLEQFDSARESLVKAADLNKVDVRAHALLASAYKGLGLHDEMMASLQVALGLNPNSYEIHAELAGGFLATGDLAEARKHALTAHDLNSSDPNVHLLVFNVAAAESDIERAEAELREFLEMFPEHAAAPQVRDRLKQIEQARSPNGE